MSGSWTKLYTQSVGLFARRSRTVGGVATPSRAVASSGNEPFACVRCEDRSAGAGDCPRCDLPMLRAQTDGDRWPNLERRLVRRAHRLFPLVRRRGADRPRRSIVDSATEELEDRGPPTPIATARGARVRLRGRLGLLRPVRAVPSSHAAAGFVGSRIARHPCACEVGCGGHHLWFEQWSRVGAFSLSDGTGRLLVLSGAALASRRAAPGRLVLLRDGAEVEVLADIERGRPPAHEGLPASYRHAGAITWLARPRLVLERT